MTWREECEPGPLRGEAGIRKAASILGRPLIQAIQSLAGLPPSTLEVMLGRRRRIVNFPKGSIDSDPLPPAA